MVDIQLSLLVLSFGVLLLLTGIMGLRMPPAWTPFDVRNLTIYVGWATYVVLAFDTLRKLHP